MDIMIDNYELMTMKFELYANKYPQFIKNFS